MPDVERNIRVLVRVRPPVNEDDNCFTCVKLDETKQTVLFKQSDSANAWKEFHFDAVLGQSSHQGDVSTAIGLSQLVAAAVSGVHATVFAYGMTGSGKTYTMEGFTYKMPHAKTMNNSPVLNKPVLPVASFESTPEEQLGVVPRCIEALFTHLGQQKTPKAGCTCTWTVHASFVQLYKEQAYDLLNPAIPNTATVAFVPSSGSNRRPGGGAGSRSRASPGQPLRMRWDAAQGFYLQNLFQVEVDSAAAALSVYRTGVRSKIMASHLLNAASSRSHCMYVLRLTCMEAGREVRSSRISLVDLAGSERMAAIGATSGTLYEESVAINKSLMTLRQVIVALSGSRVNKGSDRPAGGVHVPYRDSKLTSLLKHSLGGSSLTVMVACLSPSDSASEEISSTLEYASMARRVVNKLETNEDPTTRLVRQLRQEIAFLRQQLAAAQSVAAGSAPILPVCNDRPPTGPSDVAKHEAGVARSMSDASTENVNSVLMKLVSGVQYAGDLSNNYAALAAAYAAVCEERDRLQTDNMQLQGENASVRDQLSMFEHVTGVAAGGDTDPGNASSVTHHTSQHAALLMQLSELRQENALLHSVLQQNTQQQQAAQLLSRPGTSPGLRSRHSIGSGSGCKETLGYTRASQGSGTAMAHTVQPGFLSPLPTATGQHTPPRAGAPSARSHWQRQSDNNAKASAELMSPDQLRSVLHMRRSLSTPSAVEQVQQGLATTTGKLRRDTEASTHGGASPGGLQPQSPGHEHGLAWPLGKHAATAQDDGPGDISGGVLNHAQSILSRLSHKASPPSSSC